MAKMRTVAQSGLDKAAFQAVVQEKRIKRMEMVDQFDPEIRTLIHHYGLSVVNAFIQLGISKPKHIRHLVECVLDEFSPTRGSHSKQGVRTEVKQ